MNDDKKQFADLDDYELLNLHWGLVQLFNHYNTGDWNGTVLWKVEEALQERGLFDDGPNEDYPNGSSHVRGSLYYLKPQGANDG